MGWTADALKDVTTYDFLHEPEDSEILVAFRDAQRGVALSSGHVDGFLETGELHLTNCKLVFQEVAGEPVRSCVWTAERVKSFLANANWSKAQYSNDAELGAVLSVQKFVEVCVRFGLGIRFE